MFLISIDPGQTTGIIVAETTPYKIIDAIQLENSQSNLEKLVEILEQYLPDCIIIIERFSIYPAKAHALIHNNLPAVQVIGAVKGFCQLHKIVITEQPASMRSTISSETTYKFVPRILLKTKPHCFDAAKHLVSYVIKYQPAIFQEVMANANKTSDRN